LAFTNASGDPLDPSWQTNRFNEVLLKLGLPKIRFHDLRHTAATVLLFQGVHPKVVSEMLGHATITLKLDTYSHVGPIMHEQVAAQMDAFFGSYSVSEPFAVNQNRQK
jgi:integrase